MIAIKRLVVGPLAVNCYLVFSRESLEGVIIDPGGESEKILKAVKRSGARFKAIINTHGHFDHTGADFIKLELGIPLLIHKEELPILKNGLTDQVRLTGFGPSGGNLEPDGFLNEGDRIRLGSEELIIWHTPGHSPGGISLLGKGIIFTGDTLFCKGVGRTDLEGGDENLLNKSLRRILSLPAETLVYPGHGPVTYVEDERGII